MSVFKRGLLYITRKRGRSILLFAIILLMSVLCIMGVSIKSSADAETDQIRKNLGSSFVLEADVMNEAFRETREGDGYTYTIYTGPVVTKDIIDRVCNIDGIDRYFVEYQKGMWVSLDLIPGAWTDRVNEIKETSEEYIFPLEELEMNTSVASMVGCSDTSLQEFFRTGAFELVEGRHINNKDVGKAVISKELMERNSMNIGDTFMMELKEGIQQPSDTPNKTWGEPIKLEIIGTFGTNFEKQPSEHTYEDGYAENQIFVDIDTCNQVRGILGSATNRFDRATFFVEDARELDAVIDKAQGIAGIDWRYFNIHADDVAYKASVKPLQQMGVISTALITAAVVGCAILLFLIFNLWIKTRKIEMGILMSIGQKKSVLIVQTLFEATVLASAALLIALVLSGPVLQAFGGWIEETVSPELSQELYMPDRDKQYRLTVEKVSAEPVDLEYGISGANLLFLFLSVFGVSILGVFAASTQIMRLKPKDMLTSL